MKRMLLVLAIVGVPTILLRLLLPEQDQDLAIVLATPVLAAVMWWAFVRFSLER